MISVLSIDGERAALVVVRDGRVFMRTTKGLERVDVDPREHARDGVLDLGALLVAHQQVDYGLAAGTDRSQRLAPSVPSGHAGGQYHQRRGHLDGHPPQRTA